MPPLAELLKVVQLPSRFLFAIGVFGLVAILLPDDAADTFGIEVIGH